MKNVIIVGFIAILTLYVIMTAVIFPTSNPNVACEDVNFAANNTYYNVANSPKIVIFNGIYADDACADIYPTANWNTNGTSVKLYTNGTGDYPNITTGHHYVNYNWQSDPYIVGINFGFVVVILVLLMFYSIYKRFGK